MKTSKKIILGLCFVISSIGLSNLVNEDSFFPSLRQLSLINTAQAEVLEDVVVYPNKGTANTQSCSYWTQSYTVGGSVGGSVGTGGGNVSGGANGNVTWTEHRGTKVICPNDTNSPCDFIDCH
jgi:hypothetical protein